MEEKIKKVIKFEDLPEDVLEALSEVYPDGWKDHVKKIVKPNGDSFHAFSFDLKNISYLVKVDVRIDAENYHDKLHEDLLDGEAEKEAIKDAKREKDEEEDDDNEDND